MSTKQIGFVGIQSGSDVVQSITNGPQLPQGTTVSQLANYGYTWEGGFLYTEVNAQAPHQVISLAGASGNYQKTSMDFFGGRPPK